MPCRPGRLPTARVQALWVGHRLKWNGCYRLTRDCNEPCCISRRRPRLQRVPATLICQGNCEQREVTKKPRDPQRPYQPSSLLLSRVPSLHTLEDFPALTTAIAITARPGRRGRRHSCLWDVNQSMPGSGLTCSSPSMGGIRFQRTTSLTP